MAAAMAVLSACGPGVPQLGKSSLDEVIGAMTLEEKAHLVVGTGMAGFSGDSAVIGATRKLVPGAAGTTYPIERLGIPAVVLADGPAGLRIDPKREGDSATYYCTHFPIGTLLASTWDQELVESVGQSIGNEVLEYQYQALCCEQPGNQPYGYGCACISTRLARNLLERVRDCREGIRSLDRDVLIQLPERCLYFGKQGVADNDAA